MKTAGENDTQVTEMEQTFSSSFTITSAVREVGLNPIYVSGVILQKCIMIGHRVRETDTRGILMREAVGVFTSWLMNFTKYSASM